MLTFSLLTLSLVAQVLHMSSADPPKAPELAFTVPGQGRHLLSGYQGSVVVLDLIHTTCPSCEQTARMVDRLSGEFAGRNVRFIQVAFNPNASELVQKFTDSHELKNAVGWTTRVQVSAFLGLNARDRFAVPQVILIDAAGLIRYQTPAEGISDVRTEARLKQLITEVQTPVPATVSAVKAKH